MTTKTNTHPYQPETPSPPGETLLDLLADRSMTQAELAERLDVSSKHISQVVRGRAPVSAALALGLEKVLGVPASFWARRESLYQTHVARIREQEQLESAVSWAKRFPVAELKKRGFLPADATGASLVAAVLQFFGIASPSQWVDPVAAFRKSQKVASDPFALAAWLRAGEIEGRRLDCSPFDAKRFRQVLSEARLMTRSDPQDWHPKLVERCASAGVALVVVDTFPKAPANGATRWLSPARALIQLSLRYRWEDVFWFTFFHEAGHVLLHRKKDVFVDLPPAARDLSRPATQLESEADAFAARTLIPPAYEARLKRAEYADIEPLAAELGVAPAIVVGRLQHEQLMPFTHGNKLRRRFTMEHG